ncbi:acyltransferase [Terribacillus saccharophilus]|nr:acyltransferase [Terribacillus saccharophilus]
MTRNYSIDFFKCLAIFGVVCIHTHTFRDTAVPFGNGETWAFIIDTIARFSVPFFFAASGYLFAMKLQRTDDTFAYFKRYTGKLISLLAAWFAFYWIYDFIKIIFDHTGTRSGLKSELSSYVADTINLQTLIYGVSHTQYQLWFMFALIISVLLVFVAYRLKLLKMLVLIGLVLNVIGLLGQSYGGFLGLPVLSEFNTRDPFFFGLFYTSLGSLIGLKESKIYQVVKQIPTKNIIAIVLLLLITQLGERTLLYEILGLARGEYFLSTIPLTIMLFVLVVKEREIGKGTVFSKMGQHAVGIYLIHTLIKSLMGELNQGLVLVQHVTETFAWGIIYTPLLFIVSYFAYSGLQKFKAYMRNPISQHAPRPKTKQMGSIS